MTEAASFWLASSPVQFGGRDLSCVTHSAAGHSMLGLSGEINIEVKHNQKGTGHAMVILKTLSDMP